LKATFRSISACVTAQCPPVSLLFPPCASFLSFLAILSVGLATRFVSFLTGKIVGLAAIVTYTAHAVFLCRRTPPLCGPLTAHCSPPIDFYQSSSSFSAILFDLQGVLFPLFSGNSVHVDIFNGRHPLPLVTPLPPRGFVGALGTLLTGAIPLVFCFEPGMTAFSETSLPSQLCTLVLAGLYP